MRRRDLLVTAGAAAALPWVLEGCSRAGEDPGRPWEPVAPLAIPPVLEPVDGRLRLRLGSGRHAFLPGRPTTTWGVNGAYLGPTIRLRRGRTVTVEVTNTLSEPSTLHWHGLEVPARVDGGPHQPIAPGATWRPRLPVDQPAATLWYHPHPHGRTAEHVHRGLAGMLLVDDPESDPGLPHRYGVDDVPLVLQDRTIRPDGSSAPTTEANFGLMGEDVCVNGILRPWLRVRTSHVRLRVLNGSNARLYNLAFSDSRRFHVVAGDLGLLPVPATTTMVRLGPAERAEIVVPVEAGERVTLRTRNGDERIDRGDLGIVELRADPRLEHVPAPAGRLGGEPPLVPGPGARVRRFRLQGHDAVNGRSMDMSRIDEVVPRSALEVWEIENTVYSHNFHIHGVSFTVLAVDGRPPQAWVAGRKDTVHLPERSSARLAVQFGDHVDPTAPYMYHCHILRHEDAGMMGQYVVVEPGTEGRTPRTLVAPHAGHGTGRREHHAG